MGKWILTFLFVFSLSGVLGAPAGVAEEALTDQEIKGQQSFREVSGLETSEAHIKAVYQAQKGKKTYGAYLNSEEEEQVEKINEINDFIEDLRPMIGETEEQPSEVASFAGGFDENKFYIYLTEGNERTEGVKQRITNTFPHPEMLEFEYVPFSPLELENIKDEIDLGEHAEGFRVVSIHVDVKQNQVVVGVEEKVETAKVFFQSKYGERISAVQQDVEKNEARTTPLTTMQGGLQIGSTRKRSVNGGYCTLGFSAQGADGETYLVTAGHCMATANDRDQSYWYQGEEIIGASSRYGYNYDYDVALIKLTSGKNPSNYLYKYNSFDTKYDRETNGDPYVDQPICKSGASTGFTCGNVVAVDELMESEHKVTGDRFNIERTRKNYESDEGDSGSPVFYGGVLVGVHTGSISFSHMDSFKNRLQILAIINY